LIKPFVPPQAAEAALKDSECGLGEMPRTSIIRSLFIEPVFRWLTYQTHDLDKI
jgi:hypothetical protein